jgi:hypothetical protein
MGRMRVTRYAAALAAGGLLLSTAGCSGEAAPQGSPAPSASSSASASASVPTIPAAARGTGPKAAEAFVRHYVDLINHATATLHGSPLRRVSTSDCEACEYFVEALATTKERAGRYEGGKWTVKELDQYPRTADGDFNVRAQLIIERGRVIQESPRDVATFARQEAVYNFILVRRPEGLLVKRIAGVTQ